MSWKGESFEREMGGDVFLFGQDIWTDSKRFIEGVQYKVFLLSTVNQHLTDT